MTLLRAAARWALFAVLVVSTAAMHTQMPGDCIASTMGTETASVGGMYESGTMVSASASSMEVSATDHATLRGSSDSEPPGHGMTQVCQAAMPPTQAALSGALAVLILLTLTLPSQPRRAHQRRQVARWWLPPAPRASLGIWRI